MRRALLFGGVAVAGLLAYTVPHAMAAKEGYEQNKIRLQIQELSSENEVLQTELDRLKNPQIIASFAQQQGMAMRQKARFVTLTEQAKAAPEPSLFARLAAFSFH